MDFRIVCTEQEPASAPPTHAHIVAVGVGTDPGAATTKYTLAEVITKMEQGSRFFTKGTASGKVAWVEKYKCSSCGKTHIRSKADATTDNNLDSLRKCNWK